MLGIIMSVVAGAAMSLQGVINTRLSEKVGLYESNVFVQATALALGLIVMWLFGKGNLSEITQVNKIYWTGGILGTVIIVTVMLAIGNLRPTQAIAIILISQLLVAAVIDAFGWLGAEKISFTWNKWAGLALMIAGVIAFKWERSG
ncbi:MAG: DMT family transporter [Bacillota bacterium]|jgi:transporter family-2 protein|nr:DMT family transporter [Bacillota bacterium]NLM08445.1 DMT family transporter [Clostridiales Family XIII bacterium]